MMLITFVGFLSYKLVCSVEREPTTYICFGNHLKRIRYYFSSYFFTPILLDEDTMYYYVLYNMVFLSNTNVFLWLCN